MSFIDEVFAMISGKQTKDQKTIVALRKENATLKAQINTLAAEIAALKKPKPDKPVKPTPTPTPTPTPDPTPTPTPDPTPTPTPTGGTTIAMNLSAGLVEEGQTFDLTFVVKAGVSGRWFNFWPSGAGAGDFDRSFTDAFAQAASHGATYTADSRVVLGEDGDYTITVPMRYALDKVTEPTDQASWAAGNQEQCDLFTEPGPDVTINHVASQWVTDTSLSPPPPVIPDANTPAAIPLPAGFMNGVNLAGGEFGSGGTLWSNYAYPNNGEIDYFTGKGVNHFRIPFLVSRLLNQDWTFRDQDLGILLDLVRYAGTKGATVNLDMHNYGWSLGGLLIGRDAGSVEQFASSWGLIAGKFKAEPNVMFGIMNEPNAQSATEWLKGVNAAIKAIRNVGCGHAVIVPGSYWDGAWAWKENDNHAVMLQVADPCQNFLDEGHQYFNHDGSGNPGDPVIAGSGTRIQPMVDWAKENKRQIYIGEWGVNATPEYLAEGRTHFDLMKSSGVVKGHAYWAAGPWWGEYGFTVEPKDGTDRPQLALLT